MTHKMVRKRVRMNKIEKGQQKMYKVKSEDAHRLRKEGRMNLS